MKKIRPFVLSFLLISLPLYASTTIPENIRDQNIRARFLEHPIETEKNFKPSRQSLLVDIEELNIGKSNKHVCRSENVVLYQGEQEKTLFKIRISTLKNWDLLEPSRDYSKKSTWVCYRDLVEDLINWIPVRVFGRRIL